MAYSTLLKDSKVIVRNENGVMRIILNRPNMINSLDLEMIRLIQMALDEAEVSEKIRCVILLGNGEKGFCAGGDIKAIAQAIRDTNTHILVSFFAEEYALDLRIHNFPQPVILIADGITMGGGLGLAAGADIVVATDRTLMAMPETRIGFFPDVGATGWMFTKCPTMSLT
jgi:enoyl-CoA hydratase/carnithine racemase